MKRLPGSTRTQVEDAYRQMAHEARYRPAAPSDGFGTITVPIEDLDLNDEARRYAEQWNRDEDAQEWWLGCCDCRYRPAVVFAVEAVKELNAATSVVALPLLKMAIAAIENADAERGPSRGVTR